MPGEAFLPSPGSISNRAFLERLQLWGWKIKKVRGDDTELYAPNGAKATVRSAHSHQGNSQRTINDILDRMEMSWARFIAPMEPDELLSLRLYQQLDDEEREIIWRAGEVEQMVQMERVKEQQRAQQQRIKDERAAARKAERDRKVSHPDPTPIDATKPVSADPPEEPKEAPVNTPAPKEGPLPPVKPVDEVSTFTKGLTNRILDHLVRSDQPMSIDRLARLEPDARRDSIGAACSNLVKYGVAERVKTGVYRIRDEARRGSDVRVGLDITARTAPEPTPAPPAPVEQPVPVPIAPPVVKSEVVRSGDDRPETPAYPVVRPGSTDMDEMLNDTLDLLFPQGFKAKHLPLIDRWRQATIALMRDINEG